jgi:hypothetical protein
MFSLHKVDKYLQLLAILAFADRDRETHRSHSQAREEKASASDYERSEVTTQLEYFGAFRCEQYFKVIART